MNPNSFKTGIFSDAESMILYAPNSRRSPSFPRKFSNCSGAERKLVVSVRGSYDAITAFVIGSPEHTFRSISGKGAGGGVIFEVSISIPSIRDISRTIAREAFDFPSAE